MWSSSSSNPPQKIPSLLQNLLNFQFKFKNTEMEASYTRFQIDAEKHLLKFYNFAVLFILFVYLISSIIRDLSPFVVFYRTLVIVGLMFCYSLSQRAPRLHKALIIFFNTTTCYIVIKYMDKTGINNVKLAFLVGDFFNFMQMTFILSFRNMYQRFLVYVTLTVLKCAASTDILLSSQKYIVLLFMAVLGVIYYIYDHVQDRNIFKIIYESSDKLKKFQQLLSNDFPLSVAITDLNLQSILYSNKVFKTSFTDQKDNERASADILKKLIIDPTSLSSSNSLTQLEKLPKQSLYDFIIRTVREDLPTEENTVYTLKANYMNISGEILHYETKLSKIQWGGESAFTIVLDDVSDKETVIALKLADEQKDRVIATVSHELRTPINGILGLLEMASARVEDNLALNFLDNCKSCSKLLLYLVNSILNLSQLRNNQLVVNKDYIDLRTYFEEIRSLYIFNCQQKNIDFIIDKDPRVPSRIFTDQYKLTGILINLLGNAVKFTFKGSVTLGIQLDRNDSSRVIFSIKDTGVGIHESDRSKLFKMFGTLSQKNKSINVQGVGLGLTIASGLVEALAKESRGIKEKIEFESEPNKGSRFWFPIDIFPPSEKKFSPRTTFFEEMSSLPEQSTLSITKTPALNIHKYSNLKYNNSNKKPTYSTSLHLISPQPCDMSIPSRDSSNLSTKYSEHRKNVLIVDDFPLNLMTAAYMFEELGFQTTKAFSGQEGLDLLKKSVSSGNKFCLILTDIQMAIMDGLVMSKEITKMIAKEQIYSVPIVSITAKKLDEQEKQVHRQCGIIYSIEKPLVREHLVKILDSLGLM